VTARGEAVLEQLRARRRAAATALTADLSAAELATLHDLLARLGP
jgi:hypothetical protein